ncbi:MAG: hypothetical protein CMA12_02905 [Euryarchaeota archaeon]|nr:hypothetical protein [Euryarchaeota archaeon]OUW22641.1 MAG: hypothetical protein CBD33_01475 [Euryarchaeota archaeon TMED173]
MARPSESFETSSAESEIFRYLISEGKIKEALEISEKILENSRDLNDRDHESEAWIRMERALLGACPAEDLGPELRWCVDRLNSISSGSALHGLALLNLASWHLNSSEEMMALVTLSEISPSLGHPNDLIGLSRLESGRILVSIGDIGPAMRHLWTAMSRLSSEKMYAESLVCAIEWLDIALDEIDPNSPRMEKRISKAKPREEPGLTSSPSNPEDIRQVVDLIMPLCLQDLSGERRDDLGLIIDASDALGEKSWRNELRKRVSEIQDTRLIAELQS